MPGASLCFLLNPLPPPSLPPVIQTKRPGIWECPLSKAAWSAAARLKLRTQAIHIPVSALFPPTRPNASHFRCLFPNKMAVRKLLLILQSSQWTSFEALAQAPAASGQEPVTEERGPGGQAGPGPRGGAPVFHRECWSRARHGAFSWQSHPKQVWKTQH